MRNQKFRTRQKKKKEFNNIAFFYMKIIFYVKKYGKFEIFGDSFNLHKNLRNFMQYFNLFAWSSIPS